MQETAQDSADWKQKYRNSVLELEAEERRWRDAEKVLRRLVNRLCAAGMGANSQLDDQLAAIAAANRRQADVVELDGLAIALGGAVTAVEAVAADTQRSAEAIKKRWSSTCAAVRALLENLTEGDPDNPLATALNQDLVRAQDDAALAEVVLRMAELVHERGEQFARERLQAATVLSDVSKRLEEMVDYCAASADANRSNFAASESLNSEVMSQVRELSAEMKTVTELTTLQTIVGEALESVGVSVREFRARAEERLLEQTARTDHMRARVAELEQEARELHGKLAEERDRARIDPLTGVANRKAFDERIAQEIARRKHTDGAVTLLIWDIDKFKSINDNYGHRAGDRVLQAVAKCFAVGIRSTDFVARIGGEEFAMVMIGLKMETAMRMANELRTAVEALRFHFRGTPIRVTASCGITELKDREAAETAFDRADSALYRAKNGGRNLCIAA